MRFELAWLRNRYRRGCRASDSRVTNPVDSRTPLENGAIERDSRVGEIDPDSKLVPE